VTEASSGDFIVELLSPQHNREAFVCGVPVLNSYLQKQARQEMERRAAIPYVLVPSNNQTEIIGFYTLSSTAIRLRDLPDAVAKKLPRYPTVPAILIGRLALSRAHQGKRLGERLLVDALKRSLEASETVGAVAVIVDAKDDRGADFYVSYGFTRFKDSPLRLFIPMKTVAKL
jgi:predicted GNAT family N-acyltransferase